jgi:plasmid stabilization system protein ParE
MVRTQEASLNRAELMDPRFHRLASQEYLKALRWYAQRSVRIAAGFHQAVDDAIQLLVANPQIGTKYDDHFPWLRLRRFPYLLYYEVIGDIIHIVAVAHEKRKPGYWKRRPHKP